MRDGRLRKASVVVTEEEEARVTAGRGGVFYSGARPPVGPPLSPPLAPRTFFPFVGGLGSLAVAAWPAVVYFLSSDSLSLSERGRCVAVREV
jgi:hypothetical protein